MTTAPVDDEARGRDLLTAPQAWPLARACARRAALSRRLTRLHDYLARKDGFAFFVAHPFEIDKLSAWVVQRTSHEETYKASFRVKSDHDLPGDVLDAIQHNHSPQFTLRNIGRAERNDVDPSAPLPLQRTTSARLRARELVHEVRDARLPKVEPIEVWSLRFMQTVRLSLRRLLMEDPWELRYGAEVKANYAGPSFQYVVDGTHPDDAPEAWWGPETIPTPEQWVPAPEGTARQERALSLHDVIRRAEQGEQ